MATEKPITSMLRGLSAPVKMRFQQSDEDLALIMVSTALYVVQHCYVLHFILFLSIVDYSNMMLSLSESDENIISHRKYVIIL